MGKQIARIVGIVVVVGLIGALVFFGQKIIRERFFQRPEVASIDREEILNMSAFKKVQKSVQKKSAELEQDYAKKAQGLSPDQQKELYARFQQDLEALNQKELAPLLDKAQAAVRIVASENKLKVVLDKKIVVCGALDITEKVKEKFKIEGELTAPEEDSGEDCQIGYFDQEVVRSLKPFRDADSEFYKWYAEIKKEAEAKVQACNTPEEKQKVFMEYNAKFMSKRQQLYVPILDKVTKTVENVAQDKELILVLDKQFVMYGGRNITEEVVDSLKEK